MATILIVEDEIFIRQNAEWILEDMGHKPPVAGDLVEAMAFRPSLTSAPA